MTAAVDDPLLVRLTEAIVARIAPERILLFGSRARGDARDDSDYDVLVVVADGESLEDSENAARAKVRELGRPVDLIVSRSSSFDRRMTPRLTDVTAFHAHQCAEKHRKAVLVHEGVRPPRTHALVDVLALVQSGLGDGREIATRAPTSSGMRDR